MGYYEDQPVETFEQDEEQYGEDHGAARPVGTRRAGFRERISGALANLDRGRLDQLSIDSGAHLDEVHDVVGELHGAGYEMDADGGGETQYIDLTEPESEDADPADGPAFPVGRLGYNRAAVDSRIAEVEAELAELRAIPPQPSITEEIERLGEQTASILVVAHDQAHATTQQAEEKAQETTRLAQEQADRCVADAASNAVAITEKAKRELKELDEETDTVWRERTRLLEDARTVGQQLIALTEEAAARFPAEGKPAGTAASTPGFPPPVAGV
jgi:cell division septum initiation protein DivIVA